MYNKKASPGQLRKLEYLSRFLAYLCSIEDFVNIVTDNLSRVANMKIALIYCNEITLNNEKHSEFANLKRNKPLNFKK